MTGEYGVEHDAVWDGYRWRPCGDYGRGQMVSVANPQQAYLQHQMAMNQAYGQQNAYSSGLGPVGQPPAVQRPPEPEEPNLTLLLLGDNT